MFNRNFKNNKINIACSSHIKERLFSKILILKREKINRVNDESLKQNLRSCSEFFICVYCRLPTSDLLWHHIFWIKRWKTQSRGLCRWGFLVWWYNLFIFCLLMNDIIWGFQSFSIPYLTIVFNLKYLLQ